MQPICIIPIYSQIGDYPYKHVLYLAGQPLFCHAIAKAKNSQLFSDIIVITNDEVYAEIATQQDVIVQLHQSKASTENILLNNMIKQVLNDYEDEQSFFVLNASAIGIQEEQLIDSFTLYQETLKKAVVSVAAVSTITSKLINLNENNQIKTTYCTDDLYYPINALAISNKAYYVQSGFALSSQIEAFILSEKSTLIINSYHDFVHVLGEKYFDYKIREQNNQSMFNHQYDEKLAQPSQDKVLLGDSRTVNICLPDFKNFGLGGVTLATLMSRIEDILTDNVRVALVSIGVNDFTTQYSFETIQNNFKKLIQICRDKEIRLLLTTIPYTLYRHEVSNPPIHQMNQWLYEYCLMQQVPLLDLNEQLSFNGLLKYQYTYDGLHFTDEANQLIEQQYKQFIEQYS